MRISGVGMKCENLGKTGQNTQYTIFYGTIFNVKSQIVYIGRNERV